MQTFPCLDFSSHSRHLTVSVASSRADVSGAESEVGGVNSVTRLFSNCRSTWLVSASSRVQHPKGRARNVHM